MRGFSWKLPCLAEAKDARGVSDYSLLVGVSLLLLLFIGVFRLDGVFSKPKRTLKRRWPSCQLDEDGEPVLSDPDGRLSGAPTLSGNHIGSRLLRTFILRLAAPLGELKNSPGMEFSSH